MNDKHAEHQWRQEIARRAQSRQVLAPKRRKVDARHPPTRSRPLFLAGLIVAGLSALAGALHFGCAL